MPLKRRAAPRAEIMGWDGSAWQRLPVESSANPNLRTAIYSGPARLTILGDAIELTPVLKRKTIYRYREHGV